MFELLPRKLICPICSIDTVDYSIATKEIHFCEHCGYEYRFMKISGLIIETFGDHELSIVLTSSIKNEHFKGFVYSSGYVVKEITDKSTIEEVKRILKLRVMK